MKFDCQNLRRQITLYLVESGAIFSLGVPILIISTMEKELGLYLCVHGNYGPKTDFGSFDYRPTSGSTSGGTQDSFFMKPFPNSSSFILTFFGRSISGNGVDNGICHESSMS